MTAEAFAPSAVRARPTLTRVIVAASLGNALEWFDFLVYGYFAITIAKVFFPGPRDRRVVELRRRRDDLRRLHALHRDFADRRDRQQPLAELLHHVHCALSIIAIAFVRRRGYPQYYPAGR